ncbi:MAG: hypothetical protein RIS75_724 [Actinomycetota bacterium]|jgi:Zn-dependent protease with chaperone function
MRHAYLMSWILWLLGLAVIAFTALAATGAFGEMESENELISQVPLDPEKVADIAIPLSFIGYRKDVVDHIIEDLTQQVAQLKSK